MVPLESLSVSLAVSSHQAMISEILEERLQWLAEKGIRQWSFPQKEEWIRRCLERREFFVAETDQGVVGFFRLLESDPVIWPEKSDEAFYVHTLTVALRWRGRRMGESMLRWIESHAAGRGRRVLRLDCLAENPILSAYYERLGFHACGVREIQAHNLPVRVKRFQKAMGLS